MLERQFYIRLILNIIVGIMFAYAMVKMAQHNNQESEPKKHIVLKIIGWICIGFSVLLLISCIITLINVDFPTDIIGPFIGPNTIIRPSSAIFYWGYPTTIQNQALVSAMGTFDSLGLGCYFLFFKSSKSRWWKKILKFIIVVLMYAFMASATNFHYFDFPEFVAPIMFVALWVIVINRKNKTIESIDESEVISVATLDNNTTTVASVIDIPQEPVPSIKAEPEVLKINEPETTIENICNAEVESEDIQGAGTQAQEYGQELELERNVLYCRYCGKKIESDSTFCKYCGKQLNKTSHLNQIRKVVKTIGNYFRKLKFPKFKIGINEHKIKRLCKIFLVIIVSLVVVGGIAGGIYYYFDEVKPEKDGEKIYQSEYKQLNSLIGDELYKKCIEIIQEHNIPKTGHYWIDKKNLKDLSNEAWRKIEKLAEDGNDKAQFALATKYHGYDYSRRQWYQTKDSYGNYYNDEIDLDKAAYWYQLSATQGHSTAQNNLGICYRNGEGVTKDLRKAAYWFIKSAQNGDEYGQLSLGDCYRDGIRVKIGSHKETRKTKGNYIDREKIKGGYYDYNTHDWVTIYSVDVDDFETIIPQDIEQAKFWWEKSAAQGNQQAKERLQKIYE